MFARVAGSIQFECPRCGSISTCRVTHLHMRVRCHDSSCRRRYVVGLRFFAPLPGARRKVHRDHVPPYAKWVPSPKGRRPEPPWLSPEWAGRPKRRDDPINDFVELPVLEEELDEAAQEATMRILGESADRDA